MKDSRLIFIIVTAIFLNRLCSWAPESIRFDPFLFYDIVNKKGENIGIGLQSYIYCLCYHLFILSVWFFNIHRTGKLHTLFIYFFLIEVLSLIDFLLIFEHSFMSIGFWNVEFTDFKLIAYTSISILWSHGKL